MSGVPILEVDRLSVAYGAAVAVRDVSLSIPTGAVVGIFGPNGAGKSSLLRAIVGVVRPRRGIVRFMGTDITRRSPEVRARSGLMLVPEGRGLFGTMTVEDNLRLGLFVAGRMDKRHVTERMDQAYALFPVLKERRGQLAGTLSGGEAAMLALGRGLINQPRLLLLDEPSLGLAPGITARLFERLALLRQSAMTMVIVEQRAAELMDLVDYSMVMRQGRQEHWGAGSVELSQFDRMYFGEPA